MKGEQISLTATGGIQVERGTGGKGRFSKKKGVLFYGLREVVIRFWRGGRVKKSRPNERTRQNLGRGVFKKVNVVRVFF